MGFRFVKCETNDEESEMTQQSIDRDFDYRAMKGRTAWIITSIVFLAFAAALCASLAYAQQPRTATITFTRPTTYTDGSALGSGVTVTYNVYAGAKGSTSKTRIATITSTATTINTGLQPGETCFEVTAIANGVESAKSNEACKTFAFPAPETVTITVT